MKAGEGLFLEEHDIETRLGETSCNGGASWPSPQNDDVVLR